MNSHKNARLTLRGCELLIERTLLAKGSKRRPKPPALSLRTARKWQRRFAMHGLAALVDRSSRPVRTRSTIDVRLGQRIEQFRRARMPMRRIAVVVGRRRAIASRATPGTIAEG